MAIEPHFPTIDPFILPAEPFNDLIAAYGIRLLWRKSHACPCLYGGPTPGAADPACQTCGGRGIYWDPPSAPFVGLMTWRHMAPTPDEAGMQLHEIAGQLQHGEPTLTIPYTADASGTIWSQSSIFDAFVEMDATERFIADLVDGGITAVPYQHGLNIPASGAVTVYSTTSHQVVSVSGYTVSGASVFLPSGYASGTPYMVEFTANPVFVAARKAGALPQIRPFGSGVVNLPRRFRVQMLDVWLRARQFPGDPSAQGV